MGCACGASVAVLLRDDGRAVAVGYNHYGQCDVPALEPGARYVALAAGAFADYAAGECRVLIVRPLGPATSGCSLSLGWL